jgi:hypothetical protein
MHPFFYDPSGRATKPTMHMVCIVLWHIVAGLPAYIVAVGGWVLHLKCELIR